MSMALVECNGYGTGTPLRTHLFSAHDGGAIARWNIETQSLLAVYGVATGMHRAEAGLKCLAVRRSTPAGHTEDQDERNYNPGACEATSLIEMVACDDSGNLPLSSQCEL